jgi:hypothetical protein
MSALIYLRNRSLRTTYPIYRTFSNSTVLGSSSSSPAQTTSASSKLVLGSGSNVMDLFFPVRKLPQPGDKQYYAAETCMTESVVGGVTLNHLSWARALGTYPYFLGMFNPRFFQQEERVFMKYNRYSLPFTNFIVTKPDIRI